MKLINFKRIIVFSLILLWPLSNLPTFAEDTASKVNNVAVVNGTPILSSDYEIELDQYKQRMESQGQPVDPAMMENLKKQILDNLINMELLYQQSQKSGIEVKDEKINEEITKLKGKYASETEYENALKEMNITPVSLAERIKKGIAIQELIESEVIKLITITEADAKTFYEGNPQYFKQPETVHASHILIKVAPDAEEPVKTAAKDKITDIQSKINTGRDFAEMAKEFSEGPSNVKGGDLGFFGRGQMVKPFEDAAFSLSKDEVSGIVETQFGYHLIKLHEKKPESVIAFSDVEPKISDFLKKQKTQEKVGDYIETLKKAAVIETFI